METRARRRGGPAARIAALLLAPALTGALITGAAAASPADERDNPRPVTAVNGDGTGRDKGIVPGRYIVVYEQELSDVHGATERRGRALGFQRGHLYQNGLKGFSAKLAPGQVRALREDPVVDFVSEDRQVSATGEAEESSQVPLASGEEAPPTGVRRILAATEATGGEHSGAGVAVLDTGIDLDHPDLNAVHGRNCIGPGSADDDEGHGTHVAGTIAATNEGAGVVGVAPGTELHAVKVLDHEGNGSWSNVICGIDWVTANASALGIGVANMSLGGPGAPVLSCASTTDALHKAICDSTGAGINYVVAAGNDGWDFDFASEPDVPAAYPEVLTVTAASDSDGQPGATGGSPSCASAQSDDTRASFSNYAATADGLAHTIAAPGVCIRSTMPGGSHATMSGTSMASPHVAGLVALCLDQGGAAGSCTGLSPAAVIEHVRDRTEAFSAEELGYGFAGDPTDSVSGEHYGFLAVHPAQFPTGSGSSDPPAEEEPAPAPSKPAPAPAPAPAPTPEPEPTPPPTSPPPAPPAAPTPVLAAPTAVAIRRAVRSGRRISVAASVDRRLAGQRVELLVGTGSTLLGRARLRVDRSGRVAASGALPARASRARSLLVAIRTPSTDALRRETQIARAARYSSALRVTSGRTARVASTTRRLTVSGRARSNLRGRIILTVRYLDTAGRARAARSTARRLRDRWQASVSVPADARRGVVTIATRGDLRYHGQGITGRLPGS